MSVLPGTSSILSKSSELINKKHGQYIGKNVEKTVEETVGETVAVYFLPEACAVKHFAP